MVQGRLKSKTFRKVQRRTPGGRTVKHYVKRKPSKMVCANCGRPLSGVPREFPTKLKNMPKTKKRPERPYGGILCAKCMREEIKNKIK